MYEVARAGYKKLSIKCQAIHGAPTETRPVHCFVQIPAYYRNNYCLPFIDAITDIIVSPR